MKWIVIALYVFFILFFVPSDVDAAVYSLSFEVVESWGTGDCGQTSNIGISYNVTPDWNLEFGDVVFLAIYDSIGHPLAYHEIHPITGTIPIWLYSQAGTSQPQSRPWVVDIYDLRDFSVCVYNPAFPNLCYTMSPSTIRANFQPIQREIFDPAESNSACSYLPYVETRSLNGAVLINEGLADSSIAAYNATDDSGEPALHIYDINDEGDGTLALEITQDIIAPYIDNPPSENTALLTSADGKVTLYILDTGELQINSGPDEEGKTHVLIFDGIPPTNVYGYVIDPPFVP